jgi:formylglycine-generating enzyme required for sulfatase activity/tRNA A-37 threonylcarbamoyl transferase component Bud32
MEPSDLGGARCAGCGAALPHGARFCSACGCAIRPQAEGPTIPAGPQAAFAATRPAPPPAANIGGKGVQTPLPPMRLPTGTMLSVYRIDSVLGEGGMGVVYRAHDTARDRTVAIKCLHSNLSGDPQIRRRFAREARVLASLAHPNVVSVYDFVEHEHILGIVMEFVDGLSLVQHLKRWRGRLPFDELKSLFGGVLDAMEEGHRQGIIHRDLKPDNIIVIGGEGGVRPKVVDFGIAKILEGTTYTMTGAFLGTCAYMSPEQVQGAQEVDRRADIYSLGVTLYQLSTGVVPFESDNYFTVMMAHVHQLPRPPSELRPDLPPLLERLILDALAKNRAERPPSCEAFRERLDAALAGVAQVQTSLRPSVLPPVIRDSRGEEMVLVPAGPFQMGPERRQIHLDAFYLDRTPVTNLQFKAFLDVTGYRPEETERFLSHFRFGKIPAGHEQHPVTYVSWEDARAYAQWAGKRLPTEAEWEKAARGTDGRKYPWGRAEPGSHRANYGNAKGGPVPVGSFPEGASPYGILDLAGNVWEWCEDFDDLSFYTEGPAYNPKNTRRGEKALLVIRGGSWMYGASSLRTYARTSFEAHYRFAGGGFRCARTPS